MDANTPIDDEPTQYGPWRRIEIPEPLKELVRVPGGHGLLGLKVPLAVITSTRAKVEFACGEPGYERVIGRTEIYCYDYDYGSGRYPMSLFAVPVHTGPGPFSYRVEIGCERTKVVYDAPNTEVQR